MSTTFLQATNEILRELNEVELSASGFTSAVGIHRFAQDIINRAYLDIVNSEEEWPFLIEGSPEEPFSGSLYLETVIGTQWYTLKTGSTGTRTDFKSVDWESFYLTDYGVAGATAPYSNEGLRFLSIEEYNLHLRDRDIESVTEAEAPYDEPMYVTHSSDNRYVGLSPIPDQVYRIYFNAWAAPTRLAANTDELVIPDRWMNVLYAKARYYMWQFKESPQQASFAMQEFVQGLSQMRRNLIDPSPDDMFDDRIRVI